MRGATAVITLALGWALAALADGPPVIVAEAALRPFPVTIEALGTVRANESVEIRPLTSQQIVAIRFEEGQRVQAGDVLVELENSELRADVAAARAALAESESQLQRARDLSATRAISESELETRLTARDADRATLNAARARLDNTVVRAPFAGQLGLRNVSLGSYVTPQTVITTLDDTERLKLDFDVPETVLGKLSQGMAVEARSAAWPDERFSGRIASIDTRVDPVSRSLTVRAIVPNPEGRLRPGMFVTVELSRESSEALLVPESAIVPDRSRQYVLVVDDRNVVEQREVRIGRRRPGEVEVVSGLAAGERVIVEGSQRARPGQPVEIVATRDVPSSDGKGGP